MCVYVHVDKSAHQEERKTRKEILVVGLNVICQAGAALFILPITTSGFKSRLVKSFYTELV